MTRLMKITDASFDRAGQLRVAKVDVDENPATAARFGIQSIPTLLLFRHGKPVKRVVGAVSKELFLLAEIVAAA